jgi:ribosomal protein L37AE/L43A
MNEEEYAQQKQTMYLDEKDFLATWMFNPDIKEVADYNHLDKNLAITKLSSRYKEPEIARSILKALHILSNPKYYVKVKETILKGHEEVIANLFVCPDCEHQELVAQEMTKIKCSNCDKELDSFETSKVKVPRFEIVEVKKNKFSKTFHNLKSKFYSLTTTAAARDGHLLKAATTTHFSREESIEDKTNVKQKFNLFGGKKQGGY